MDSFLLEIGTEELPPGVIPGAAEELKRRIVNLLEENGVRFGAGEALFSPRRLTVLIKGVAKEKPSAVVEVQGPPKRVSFDSDGKPTKTAMGFAAAQGKRVEDLFVKETAKGDYVFVKKEIPAVPTAKILADRLPEVIATLPFPKLMRWNEGNFRFSRPVRWILCLLGSEVVPFSIEGIVAGNVTFGHRNFSEGPVVISEADDYEQLLESYKVVVNPYRRRSLLLERLTELAAEVNGLIVKDEELIEETVNITEFPVPILGRFDPQYLKLPAEVLTTALRMHQRCFSVADLDGGLLPYFIAVANTPNCDQGLVRRGYERAIESRLRDALFFVENDLKTGLESLVEEERRVVWIEGLSSYYEKTIRLRQLASFIAESVPDADKALLDRAAYLCKADLLTQLVREKEFTSLQGVMGGIYARLLGENEMVAQAIGEHYQPKGPDDGLPKTVLGGILSIADKIDNIIGTYLTGNIPTGSEDPFAVRRQASGLLLIILENGWQIAVDELVQKGLELFGRGDEKVRDMVLQLLQERLAAILSEKGVRYDVANAVLKTVWHTPSEALARAQALQNLRTSLEFSRLVIGQKRVANILRGQEVSGVPEPKLFVDEAERVLWEKAREVEPELERMLRKRDYDAALKILLSLRESIDRFFDDVLVMCEDENLRLNRLRLLNLVRGLFARVADLSEIVL
ncbi:MAG: glycine--tRNA ligase subunit beta [candidate division WOR-3 bacterium]